MLSILRRLLRYAAPERSPSFFTFSGTISSSSSTARLLMLYYKLLGKRIVFTAHNVNAGKRDSNDSWLNRLSLKVQYNLSDHLFVHTEGMKSETDLRISHSREQGQRYPIWD